MKKILFIASTILILLSGCENFLDSELLTEKTTANFPETEKDAQEMVTAIYRRGRKGHQGSYPKIDERQG